MVKGKNFLKGTVAGTHAPEAYYFTTTGFPLAWTLFVV
jgi:hypothetical protein